MSWVLSFIWGGGGGSAAPVCPTPPLSTARCHPCSPRTRAWRRPTKRLNSADLPTLGRPTRATWRAGTGWPGWAPALRPCALPSHPLTTPHHRQGRVGGSCCHRGRALGPARGQQTAPSRHRRPGQAGGQPGSQHRSGLLGHPAPAARPARWAARASGTQHPGGPANTTAPRRGRGAVTWRATRPCKPLHPATRPCQDCAATRGRPPTRLHARPRPADPSRWRGRRPGTADGGALTTRCLWPRPAPHARRGGCTWPGRRRSRGPLACARPSSRARHGPCGWKVSGDRVQ